MLKLMKYNLLIDSQIFLCRYKIIYYNQLQNDQFLSENNNYTNLSRFPYCS